MSLGLIAVCVPFTVRRIIDIVLCTIGYYIKHVLHTRAGGCEQASDEKSNPLYSVTKVLHTKISIIIHIKFTWSENISNKTAT